MDREEFEERAEKIKEVDAFVKTLDSSVREAAFRLLESYITGGPGRSARSLLRNALHSLRSAL